MTRSTLYIKAVFAFLLIMVIIFIAIAFHKREMKKIVLRDSGLILEADLLKLNCVQGSVTFKLNGKIFTQRIYLTRRECETLTSKNTIRLKVLSPDEFVYAEEEYNDWIEAEIVSTWILAAALMIAIAYYYIWPLRDAIGQ